MGETRLLDVRYLARCKARGPRAELSAVAWVDGRWSVIVPEPVLRSWFNAVAAPDEAPTFYAALGIAIDATNADIKKAYRRLALTLHPDRNHEPDATEQFRAIQRAYEVLSQADTRARYDAGMKLEALARSTSRRTLQGSLGIPDTYGYRSPLRSGYVMVQGNQQNRWFIVNLILAWADIVDAQGRTLVSSWPAGADHHLEVWA